MLNIVRSALKIGLPAPVKLLHVTDTHLSETDFRDNRRTRKICRSGHEKQIRENFREAIAYSNANCDLMVHTGDLINVVSVHSLEVARTLLDSCNNYLIIAGNHEFSLSCGEAWEDEAYKMTSYPKVHHILKENLLFSAKTVGGVNVVGVDNSYYQTDPWQLWRLKQEVKKGLPIVLMMHVPIFEEGLFQKVMEENRREAAYLMGCDEEHLAQFSSEFRQVQQRPTRETVEFVNYVCNEPMIRCVLAGHVHMPHESMLPGRTWQYVTSWNRKGEARELLLY